MTTRIYVPDDTTACSLGADTVAAELRRLVAMRGDDAVVVRNGSRGHYALEKLWGDAKQVRIPSGHGVRPPLPARSMTARAPRVRKRG